MQTNFRFRTEARTSNNVDIASCLHSRLMTEKVLRSSRERRPRTERFISGGRAFHPRGIWGGGVGGGRGRTVIEEVAAIDTYIRPAALESQVSTRFRRLWPIKS